MLLQQPFHAITTSVDGDVLAALAVATAPMTIAEILQRSSTRSYAGVRNSAERLVQQGVLTGDRVGRTKTFALNRDHLAAPAVALLAQQREEFLRRLRDGCAPLSLRFAAVFGSAARGSMSPESDIDLCFVVAGHGRDAAEDGIHDLCDRASRWTGNPVRPVFFDEDDLDPSDPLLRSVAEEGVPIAGDGRWLVRKLRSLVG